MMGGSRAAPAGARGANWAEFQGLNVIWRLARDWTKCRSSRVARFANRGIIAPLLFCRLLRTMGNTPSLHETVFDLRYNAKQLERMSKKCEKNAAKQRALVKAALEKGNMEGARIYGANAIREKNQGLNYLRLASRVEGAAARVESAAQTQKVGRVCPLDACTCA